MIKSKTLVIFHRASERRLLTSHSQPIDQARRIICDRQKTPKKMDYSKIMTLENIPQSSKA